MSASSELHPRPLLPAGAPASSSGLLLAVVGGLALIALGDAFGLFAGFRLRAALGSAEGGFVTDSPQELEAAGSLYGTVSRYQGFVYLPTAIVFIAWFFRMRRNTGLLAPDRFRNGPGWAIGAWFIPLVNLWMPYRIALDMWGAATLLPEEGERYRTRIWPVNLWWGSFVFSVLFNRYAGTKYDGAAKVTEIRDRVTLYMAADVVNIVAAAAAVYFAVRLTSMQRLKAAEGPYRSAVVEKTSD